MTLCLLVITILAYISVFVYGIVLDKGVVPRDSQKEVLSKIDTKYDGFSVPLKLDLTYDLCLIFFVVTSGWIWYGMVLLVNCIFQFFIRKQLKALRLNLKRVSDMENATSV